MTLSENVQKVIELSQRIVVEKSVIQTYDDIRRNTMTTEYNVEKHTMTTSTSSSLSTATGLGAVGGATHAVPIHSSQTTTESAHRVTERKFHTSSSASEILIKGMGTTLSDDTIEIGAVPKTSNEDEQKHPEEDSTTKDGVGCSKYTREGFLEAMKNSYSLDSMLSSRAGKVGGDENGHINQTLPKPPQSEQDFKVRNRAEQCRRQWFCG